MQKLTEIFLALGMDEKPIILVGFRANGKIVLSPDLSSSVFIFCLSLFKNKAKILKDGFYFTINYVLPQL